MPRRYRALTGRRVDHEHAALPNRSIFLMRSPGRALSEIWHRGCSHPACDQTRKEVTQMVKKLLVLGMAMLAVLAAVAPSVYAKGGVEDPGCPPHVDLPGCA